MIHYVDVKLL